jgi:hypothetical protein
MSERENAEWCKIENLKKLTVEDAKFFFDQAEKQLKETSESSSLIVGRVSTLLTLIAGLFIALVGFTINKYAASHKLNELLITAIIGIPYLFYILYQLVINLRGWNYRVIGSEPKSLFSDVFFDDSIESKNRIINLYASEMREYQIRIEENKVINEKRWKLYDDTLLGIILFPLVMVIVFILLSCLNHL